MPEPLARRLAHPCFSQPQDPSCHVWRYMTLPKFVALLQKQSLFFGRLDRLSDVHEGSLPRLLAESRAAVIQQNNSLPADAELSEISRQVRRACYVNCWALSSFESEALWRLYTVAGDGVAIRTTYQRLIEPAAHDDDMYVGMIQYIDYETEWFPDGNVFYPIMHKRRAFAHEQEIRLLKMLYQHVPLNSPCGPLGFPVPVPLDDLIEEIFVSPYAEDWYADTVQAVVEQFAPTLVPKLRWSKMKSEPLY